MGMKSTRREFLRKSAILATSGFAALGLKKKPALAFSTLGCPDWSFPEIINFAAAHQYTGIELRGIQHEMDLTQCAIFKTTRNRLDALQMMEEKGLHFVDLGSSANLHVANLAEREKNLDEAKRFIDLAAELKCPFVRVFPNIFPKDEDKRETMDRMAKGLLVLADYARETKVSTLVETHGDLVRSADIERLMESASHPHAGLVWDVANMWTITREPPAEVYPRLSKYIKHTHIKDAKIKDGNPAYVFLGRGEVPIFEAIDALAAGGYTGYYSFEWEKLWHPEIAEPAAAIADYSQVMMKHFE